jgi:RNA polymerase sigma factor (sigma-70 family)
MQKLAPWRIPCNSASDFVRTHYADVFAWCRQITGDDTHEAEDLIQDAFILLSHASVSSEDLRNVEGYIYVILRNLHKSRYERGRRHVPLPILDYDCARLGLSVTDSSHLLIVADQLRRICLFACERKETSRAGSVLILRFFHGYYPTEIAGILVSSRRSVEEHLRAVRKEASDFLAGTAKASLAGVKATGQPAEPPAPRTLVSETTETLLVELQSRIFASCSSGCPGSAALARWYRPEAVTPISVDLLSHIVSCAPCLDEVNRLLNLSPLNTRNPSDSAGKQSGSGFNVFSRRSGSKNNRARRSGIKRFDHLAGELFEHRPERLCVAVNGQPVVTQPIVAPHSEVTIRLQQSTGIEFIEVFSEQDLRLLMIPIRQLPPNGPFEQSAVTRLSEGRELKATFRYTSPWPTIYVSYCSEVLESSDFAREATGTTVPPSTEQPAQILGPWSSPLWRPAWRWVGFAVSSLAILLYLVEQTRYNTAEARTLVAQCTAWEDAVREPTQNVVRQRFDFRERTSPSAKGETIEVWRGSGRHDRFVRHLDNLGRVLGTSDSPPRRAFEEQADQIWKFDPSAETFVAFAQPREGLRVHDHGQASDVEAAQITLTLDKGTHRPIGEVLHTHGREFEFVETSFDLVPAANSPISPARAQSTEHHRSSPVLPRNAAPLLPTTAQLELAELQARVALHALGADLHDGVQFEQNLDSVTVDVLVETREDQNKAVAALDQIPLITPYFRVIADLALTARAASTSPPREKPTFYQPLMEPYLRGQLESAAAVNQVMAAAARASDDLLHRAVALSQLSTRYPAATISSLSPDARLELLRLVQDHLSELEIERKNFQAIVLDLVRPVASDWHESVTKDAADNWTESSKLLLDTVQTLHGICSSLFVETTRGNNNTLGNLTGRVLVVAERLKPEAERLQRQLAAHIGQ